MRCLELNQLDCKIKTIARVVDCSNLGLIEFHPAMLPSHVRGGGYMLDLSDNMLKSVDIDELPSAFNTVDLRENPCCYTLYPIWSGCIITVSNSNSVLTILLLFITNTIFIAAGCFPNIIDYVAQVNDYYVRAMRWVALIRRFQRPGNMQWLFAQEAQPALPAEEAAPVGPVNPPDPNNRQNN